MSSQLPPVISNSYRQYKEESRIWLTYLESSAALYGYYANVEHSGGNTAPRGTENSRRLPHDQSTCTIAINESDTMARLIVFSKAKVPWSIIRLVNSIIARRKKCAEWYSNTQGQDNGHTHIIRELEKTLITLLRGVERSAETSTHAIPNVKRPEINLDSEQSDDDSVLDRSLAAADYSTPEYLTKPMVLYEEEVSSIDDEFIHMLL
jgi:hypothetical protein